MAKDDYDVIAYRILTYLYACMKRKILFDEATFRAAVRKNVDSEEYFTTVLKLMTDEGLIEGLVIIRAWGDTYILASDIRDMRITASGIHYIKDNSMMRKIGETLRESADIISELASLIGLI